MALLRRCIVLTTAICYIGTTAFTLNGKSTRLSHRLSAEAGNDESNIKRTKSMQERLAALNQSGGGPHLEDSSPDPRDVAKEGPSYDTRPMKVQGGSLRTWALKSASFERVQIHLSTEGRPLDADVDLWHGPDNTPHKMRIYLEDGSVRPFHAILETPRGPNTVAVRNIGQLEFPFAATVVPNPASVDRDAPLLLADSVPPRTIQGGALRTYPFDAEVESVQILLKTDGRPLNARIELLQGPNNVKQVIELYVEDAMERPFFMVIQSPGTGNVVRIVNTATVEFPMSVWVEPFLVADRPPDDGSNDFNIVVGGDDSGFGQDWNPQWKR